MSEWKVDDVVMLKSGGPTMTVRQVLDHAVLCMWFIDNTPHHRMFTDAVLVTVRMGSL